MHSRTYFHITQLICYFSVTRSRNKKPCYKVIDFIKLQQNNTNIKAYHENHTLSVQFQAILVIFLSVGMIEFNHLSLDIFDKMAAFGNFGCPKFTLDRISGHFRSIGHFGFQKLTNKIFFVDQRSYDST